MVCLQYAPMKTLLLIGVVILGPGIAPQAQQIIAQAGDRVPGGGTIKSISQAVMGSEGLVAFIAKTDKPREVVALLGRPGKPGAPLVWQRALLADAPRPVRRRMRNCS